jgi:hypothetical protein
LPIYVAKKDKQSSSFFGVKTRKTHGWANSALGLYGLKRRPGLISNPRQTGTRPKAGLAKPDVAKPRKK